MSLDGHLRVSCTMLNLWASLSLSMDTSPRTRKIARKLALDVRYAAQNCIGSRPLPCNCRPGIPSKPPERNLFGGFKGRGWSVVIVKA
ncbi:hypothetical protein B0H14DRAFT_291420 [Mycena olivaceomarginata]|nr:hypothetical protein B0H14DRAFT_291420 [Mycena olivaceomarginata]